MIVNKRFQFHGLVEKHRKGSNMTILDERNGYNSVWQHLAEDLWKSGLLSRNNDNCIFLMTVFQDIACAFCFLTGRIGIFIIIGKY